MVEAVLTTTTNASVIPTIISQKALGRLGSYLSLAKNVSKDSDWTPSSIGTTLQIAKRGAVVANDKTQGSNFTKQNPSLTHVQVTLNKHKEATVTIDDVTKVVENQDTLSGYADDIAIALAEAIEDTVASLHSSVENTVTWNRTSATTIDASMLLIRKFFTDQKVPKPEQRYFYVDATVFNDLLGVQKYTDQSWRGNQNSVAEGTMIRTYGFEIEESQSIKVTGSPVAYHNLAYTKNAFVLASRPLPRPEGFGGKFSIVNDPSVGVSLRTLFWYNADLGAHQLTVETLFGAAVLDQRRVVEVESF